MYCVRGALSATVSTTLPWGSLEVYGPKVPVPDAAKVTERFRRVDFGHMEIQITVDDPKVYTKPFTFKVNQVLAPDTELIEFICLENEKDIQHMNAGAAGERT